jgi:ATP-dependent DNA helicase RecG
MKQEELQALIEQGEGFHLEFKESVNSGLAKELVAFANAKGGRVIIGVDDNGQIGQNKLDNTVKSRVQDIARECDPSIDIEIEVVEGDDRVFSLQVNEGLNKPYRSTGGFYLREGASSNKRRTAEIHEMFKDAGRFTFDDVMAPQVVFSDNYEPTLLRGFLSRAKINQVLSDEDTICNLGASVYKDGEYIFNNTGVLFFSKDPEQFNRHAIIQCARYNGNQKIDIADQQDLKKDIITNIEDAMLFLKKHLNVAFKFESGRTQRREEWEIPYVALKEAVVNAIAHRDYVDRGTHIQVEIFDDRVSITNYGGLKKGFNIDDIGKRSYHRNPNIVNLLHRANYIEKMGTGILRINKELSDVGLPKVEFDVNEYWFTIIFGRSKKAEQVILETDFKFNNVQAKIVSFCLEPKSRKAIFEYVELSNQFSNYKRLIIPLIEQGFLERTIPDKPSSQNQEYYTTDLGSQILKK